MYNPINNQRFCTLQFQGQFDAIGDSEELVDDISNSEELVDAVSNPKRDPISDPKVSTYLHYEQKLSTKTFQQPLHPKDHPRHHPSD